MLKIRLQRVGRKNHAEFRVIVSEHTKSPKRGKALEVVGTYNPHTDVVEFKKDRILHWMSNGAQASDTVHNLLLSKKIIEGKKINVLPKKTAPVKEEVKEEAKTESKVETPVEVKEEVVEEAGEEIKEESAETTPVEAK